MTGTCPCGHNRAYLECCGRYIDGGDAAPTAEALMRSRYTAYTLGREAYLLSSWHASTRPASLQLAGEAQTKWLGLDVLHYDIDAADADRATVEFVARFKVGGERAERLHELSRFVREHGNWFYVDGNTDASGVKARGNLRKTS